MKSMFDNWYGGNLTSRQMMQNKIRAMQVSQTVQGETAKVIDARKPADQIEALANFNADRKYKVIQQEKSAPYVGERY